jgi:hypothetical protein
MPKHLAERILTTKAALEGDRKQGSVLFADLKGSMEPKSPEPCTCRRHTVVRQNGIMCAAPHGGLSRARRA